MTSLRNTDPLKTLAAARRDAASWELRHNLRLEELQKVRSGETRLNAYQTQLVRNSNDICACMILDCSMSARAVQPDEASVILLVKNTLVSIVALQKLILAWNEWHQNKV